MQISLAQSFWVQHKGNVMHEERLVSRNSMYNLSLLFPCHGILLILAYFSLIWRSFRMLLKVHYATFLRACKQIDRALDAKNSL